MRLIKRILVMFLMTSLLVVMATPIQAMASTKVYGVLIGDKDNNYELYDDLTVISPKGNVMVQAYNICSKLSLDYKYDSKSKKLTIENKDNGKSIILTRDSKTYLYYENKTAEGLKKTAAYQFYYSKDYKCNVIHMATLKYLLNYKYYSATEAKQYKANGYTGGVVAYSRYNKIDTLPISDAIQIGETEIIVDEYGNVGVAGVIQDIDIDYDTARSIDINVNKLNDALDNTYGVSWTVEDSLQVSGQTTPTSFYLLKGVDKIGIRLYGWRTSYNSSNILNRYLNAILETFRFLGGDNLGNDLWLLVDDMFINNGVDETKYGFKDNGKALVYKNDNSIGYEFTDDYVTFWFTPNNY